MYVCVFVALLTVAEVVSPNEFASTEVLMIIHFKLNTTNQQNITYKLIFTYLHV